MGSDVLGGTKLWLKGESGTYYYYAHLSAFAEGLADGTVVEAGDVVGPGGRHRQRQGRGAPPALRDPSRRRDGRQPVPPAQGRRRPEPAGQGARARADPRWTSSPPCRRPAPPAVAVPVGGGPGPLPGLARHRAPGGGRGPPMPTMSGPAWSVDLRGRLGPFARAKRLRMVRTAHERRPPTCASSGWSTTAGDHSPLGARRRGRAEPRAGASSPCASTTAGRLWMPALDRLLADEIERSRPRLLARLGG